MPNRRGSLLDQIRQSLDKRRFNQADNARRFYLTPYGNRGLALVRRECNPQAFVVNGGGVTFAPGAVVMTGSVAGTQGEVIIGPPPAGRLGGSQFPQLFPPASGVDVVKVTSGDPPTLPRGIANQAVTLNGVGFLQDPLDIFSASVFNETTKDWTADPFATIHDVAWVSDTQVTALVDVSASAPVLYKIGVLVKRA